MSESDLTDAALAHALRHLHDPGYVPDPLIHSLVRCDDQATPAQVQCALVAAIGALAPASDIPEGARSRLLFDILHFRFVEGCTQEQTAEQLGISVRQLNRLQREAVHLLALHLRAMPPPTGSPPALPPQSSETTPVVGEPGDTDDSWEDQVAESVSALAAQGEETTVDLAAEVRTALSLLCSLDSRLTFEVVGQRPAAPIVVEVHPAALRQIVIAITRELLESTQSTQITCDLSVSAGSAVVRLAATGSRPFGSLRLHLAQELARACGASLAPECEGDQAAVSLLLSRSEPLHDRRTVLAVDDNKDLAALFEAYCTGTRYQLLHVRTGAEALRAVAENRPDAVLLDVMLPDMDGWELLRALRKELYSASVPVIVCSVITDAELALKLGASAYLRKPVWRQQLLEALDKVISRGPQ